MYVGEYKDDKYHGSGTLTWNEDGFSIIYTGEFKNGKFNGKGKLTKIPEEENTKKTIVYTGDFSEGFITYGKWEAFFGDRVEASYEGEFKNNKFEGKGIFVSYLEDDGNYNRKGAWKNKTTFKNGEPT